MRTAWPRLGIELAVEDLRSQPFGKGFKLFIEGLLGLCACVHVGSLSVEFR